jgi:hypothetical protein
MLADPDARQAARVAYAAEGAKQFTWSFDHAARQFRGMNENATMLFSGPERTDAQWLAVAPWALAEGEIINLAGQHADFRVTWARAQRRAA